eukprot:XP_011683316.1 PREDICTED: bombesin receptor subtype-3-like [Strongylocentrotus purpuratus]
MNTIITHDTKTAAESITLYNLQTYSPNNQRPLTMFVKLTVNDTSPTIKSAKIMDPEESTHFNNNNRTHVLSSENSSLRLSALIPVVAIYGILIAITVIGNLFVIISYFQERKLRQRPANLIILNLAFADLIVGLVSLTVNLTTIVTGRWLFGEAIICILSLRRLSTKVGVSLLTWK